MDWQPIDVDYLDYTQIIGMDCRADWLLGAGSQDFVPGGEEPLIPFIIRLHNDDGITPFMRIYERDKPLLISDANLKRLQDSRYCTAFAPILFFDNLVEGKGLYDELRAAPKEIRFSSPLKASSLPKWTYGEDSPKLEKSIIAGPYDWSADTAVVGIIDDGIAFAHERFRSALLETRIECFWLQEELYNPMLGFLSGREICKPEIDNLLALFEVAGSIDEDAVYREAGVIDFSRSGHKAAAWRASHGTHVLDLAAGENFNDGVENRPIVCVQLPSDITEDTSGAGLEAFLLDAVDYIVERADELAGGGPPLPVVINFSYGLIAGPHDGTSSLEQAFEDRILDRENKGKLRIVLPAGNSHLSRCHAEIKFANIGDEVALDWKVQPDDKTPSFLEIWLPYHDGPVPEPYRLRLSVESPNGVRSAWLEEIHNSGAILIDGGKVICEARYVFAGFPTARGLFCITLQPTARLQPTDDAVAPSGKWTVRLENVALSNTEFVQAWIQRDNTPHGYPVRGRQSYFDNSCYSRFGEQGRVIVEDADDPQQPGCVVKRAGLINAIASGATTIVAGGFNGNDFRPVQYSGGGPITPTRDLSLPLGSRKPDVMAVSDDSKVHSGVLAAGSHSGSVVAFTGTSVAAPQITRWIAMKLASNDAANRDAVKVRAQAEENAPEPKPPLPVDRGGWGRLGYTTIHGLPIVRLPRSHKDPP